jgi:hypothetical protein
MVLTVTLSVLIAVVFCVVVAREVLTALGLKPMQTLVWLGLAEVPPPPVRRRARPRSI